MGSTHHVSNDMLQCTCVHLPSALAGGLEPTANIQTLEEGKELSWTLLLPALDM